MKTNFYVGAFLWMMVVFFGGQIILDIALVKQINTEDKLISDLVAIINERSVR